ncbi:hypothetical protein [Pontibacter roseus]|uniref:hypothetical protein n=1 Tax=Pontibacter roseus TaxID=336989 RepID=UPI00037F22C5|nr:hypothetical protein [Pontibacter roseus]
MNKTLFIFGFLSFGICSAAILQDGIIRIGKFAYKTKKSKVFLKDESYHCDWFSLYSPGDEHQAGLIVEAKRNDTLFVSGTYKIEPNEFIVTNYYHYRHSHEPDSSVKIFAQHAGGKLKLSSFIEYTDGIAKQIR